MDLINSFNNTFSSFIFQLEKNALETSFFLSIIFSPKNISWMKSGVKNIQPTAYNGVRTVLNYTFLWEWMNDSGIRDKMIYWRCLALFSVCFKFMIHINKKVYGQHCWTVLIVAKDILIRGFHCTTGSNTFWSM